VGEGGREKEGLEAVHGGSGACSEPMSRMIWPIEMLQQQLPPDASNNSLLDS